MYPSKLIFLTFNRYRVVFIVFIVIDHTSAIIFARKNKQILDTKIEFFIAKYLECKLIAHVACDRWHDILFLFFCLFIFDIYYPYHTPINKSIYIIFLAIIEKYIIILATRQRGLENVYICNSRSYNRRFSWRLEFKIHIHWFSVGPSLYSKNTLEKLKLCVKITPRNMQQKLKSVILLHR